MLCKWPVRDFRCHMPHPSLGILSHVCLQHVIVQLNKKSQGHQYSQSQRKVRHIASSSLAWLYLSDEDIVCWHPGVIKSTLNGGACVAVHFKLRNFIWSDSLIAVVSKVEGGRASPLLRWALSSGDCPAPSGFVLGLQSHMSGAACGGTAYVRVYLCYLLFSSTYSEYWGNWQGTEVLINK